MNRDTIWTRRDWGQLLGGVAGSGLFFPDLSLSAQDAGAPGIEPFNRFPRMVHNYYHAQLTAFERRTLKKKKALSNADEARAYVKDVQERIARAFAPMPKKKTPLKARVTGKLERDGYAIEKVIFESRPGFLVTAHLYLPEGASGEKKVPGVVGTCGHSRNGKNAEAYQAFAQGLARMGTACLIYDPIGQGERSQYLDDKHELIYKGTTHEHNMAGNQMELIGEFLGSWRAWDGIRALDYLLARPEIDSKHVGVTGNSGGGTMTTWLLGAEQRWTMGAPACFVTTWRRNFENELPQDNEQCPPRSLALGLDHDDYLAAMAPKPIIILAKEKDYFDARGSEETLGRLRRLYGLLGKEENVQLHIGPTTHGYTQENREAMYRFFNSVTGVSDAQTEPELLIEDDETLWCTPTGQVTIDPGSKTVFHFTEARAKQLAKKRGENPLRGEKLRGAVKASLRLPDRKEVDPPRVRIIRAIGGNRKYPAPYWINYAVETEPGIEAVCTMLGTERLYSRPPRRSEGQSGRVLLWIANVSSDAELREDPELRSWMEEAEEGVPRFACDVRGVGESLPITAGANPHGYYGADYFYSAYANMLNRPYLGGKVNDVLRTIDFLAGYGWDDVHIAGKGRGALVAALAAVLDDRVREITLHEELESWHSVATDEHYEWPLSHMLMGVLRSWDLPDVYAELDGRA
jgi:cephalosporin-C deacetylase-like acetyl esterase